MTFGNYLRQFVNIVFFFANWGTAIAYLVLVSRLIKSAFLSFKPLGFTINGACFWYLFWQKHFT